ncbi:MAG: T9SS type A sorting domain-containing protein, partial [Mesonia sp.]
NLNGQEVLSKKLNSTDENIQIENLAPDVYLTRLIFEKDTQTFKFINK